MRLRSTSACAVLLVLGLSALPSSPAEGASPSARLASIQDRIEIKRGLIGRKKGTERALGREIAVYSARIGRLESKIGRLRARYDRVQSDLDAKRAELARIQSELRAERRRLARLRVRLAEARRVVGERLVELYQADEPDLVTVVLNSDGFADLLERGEFLRRIREQDERIVKTVRAARIDARRTAARLDRLERRQQRVTAIVLERRNEIAAVKNELIGTREGMEGTRSDKRNALQKVRARRMHHQKELDELERESERVAARLRAPGTIPAGPIRKGSGALIWPVNGAFTSPFGMRWGRLHAGIDVAAPTGTPIRAADSGRVVLLGWTGGYGNYTCVAHSAAQSTCYAHQSRYATSNGASVSKGQVIGYVGNTGNSTGPHLHFEVRINGSPVDPMGYL